MKNRKLRSHAYYGWRVKDAIEHAVKCPDVVLRYETKLKNSTNLLDTETVEVPYLICYDNNRTYRIKLTQEEANYYKALEGRLKCK